MRNTSMTTQEEIVKNLPELATRVHNLKGKHYNGCGFHYSMVNTLNYLLEVANCELDLEGSILFEVSYEDLVKSVTAAENN